MAGYRYMYSVSSSSSNTEEPPQLSNEWSYNSNHHGRPVFEANEQGRPLTSYYDPKDFAESHVIQRENVVERVYSSEDGAYNYVVVTKTGPRSLTRGSLEGTPAEVSELFTRILNEVSEPLQELHVTDIYDGRYRGPSNPTRDYPQRVDNYDRHRRPLSPTRDYPQSPSSASYWMQLAKFKKHEKPITKTHVSDYKNKGLHQPTMFSEDEPTRILTGPGTARPTGTTWATPKGRDTCLSTPTNDNDEAMRLMLAAARSSAPIGDTPNSYGYGGIRDHRETVRPFFNGPDPSFSSLDGYGEPIYRKEGARPSAHAAHPEIGQDKPPVLPMPLNRRYGEPINKGEVAKPSKYATAPEIGQYNPAVSTLPMKDNYGQPINKRDAKPSPKDSYGYSNHNNETVKPTHHAITSGIPQGNNPASSMPKKDSYEEPINKNGPVKPSPYSIASAEPHYKSKAAKPTSITTSSPSLINPPPSSHEPNRNTSKEPMIRNEAIKPSLHKTASPGSKFSAPLLPLSNKYGYNETKENKEAAKPTHAITASPVLPSKYMPVSSAPMETYPVINARRYGSADTIDSREAARLYGTAGASSSAHIVNHDDEDDGLPKITSKEAAKKYDGKFVF